MQILRRNPATSNSAAAFHSSIRPRRGPANSSRANWNRPAQPDRQLNALPFGWTGAFRTGPLCSHLGGFATRPRCQPNPRKFRSNLSYRDIVPKNYQLLIWVLYNLLNKPYVYRIGHRNSTQGRRTALGRGLGRNGRPRGWCMAVACSVPSQQAGTAGIDGISCASLCRCMVMWFIECGNSAFEYTAQRREVGSWTLLFISTCRRFTDYSRGCR